VLVEPNEQRETSQTCLSVGKAIMPGMPQLRTFNMKDHRFQMVIRSHLKTGQFSGLATA